MEWPAPRVLTTMSSVPEQTQPGSGETAARVRGLDTSVAHPARVYDYLLGGKDNITQVVTGNWSGRFSTVVIAVQRLLFENVPRERSLPFAYHLTPLCPFLRVGCPE